MSNAYRLLFRQFTCFRLFPPSCCGWIKVRCNEIESPEGILRMLEAGMREAAGGDDDRNADIYIRAYYTKAYEHSLNWPATPRSEVRAQFYD